MLVLMLLPTVNASRARACARLARAHARARLSRARARARAELLFPSRGSSVLGGRKGRTPVREMVEGHWFVVYCSVL